MPIRPVRRDHDVGRGERQSLRSAHESIAPVAPPELRLAELWHDVVLVEDHAGAVNSPVPAGDQKGEVGWVADVHHAGGSLAPDAPSEAEVVPECGGMLARVAAEPLLLGRQIVPMDVDSIEVAYLASDGAARNPASAPPSHVSTWGASVQARMQVCAAQSFCNSA